MSGWIDFWKQLDGFAASQAEKALKAMGWSIRQEKSGLWVASSRLGFAIKARSPVRLLECVEEHEKRAASGDEMGWFA